MLVILQLERRDPILSSPLLPAYPPYLGWGGGGATAGQSNFPATPRLPRTSHPASPFAVDGGPARPARALLSHHLGLLPASPSEEVDSGLRMQAGTEQQYACILAITLSSSAESSWASIVRDRAGPNHHPLPNFSSYCHICYNNEYLQQLLPHLIQQ